MSDKPHDKPRGATAMWGGHFSADQAEIMQKINASIDFDKRLYAEDIAGSRAHADMLVAQGILSAEDGANIMHSHIGSTEALMTIHGSSGMCPPNALARVGARRIMSHPMGGP